MKIESYTQIGGIHPETATITNILASQGVVAPHNNKPLTEAMVFGVAGGLGCGYILWEFKKYDSAVLVLGFQNRWNYPMEYMQRLCDRLGITAEFKVTGGKKKAASELDEVLAGQQPAVTWVDQQSLPYFFMRPMYDGCFGHYVSVFGSEEDRYLIDDRATVPFQVEKTVFNQARARIGSYKNRLLCISAEAASIDIESPIRAGLADCIDYMGRDSQTFAIPVYRKWARLMTDSKNKKGWPKVFGNQNGLYSTLRSLYESIELFGTGGGGLRGLYAEFLEEADSVLGNGGLADAAAEYLELAKLWSSFGSVVLPESVPALAETRRLLTKKYAIFNEKGGEGLEELQTISENLVDMEEELNSHLALSESEMNELFSDMQERLFEIYDTEKRALDVLRSAAL